MELKGSTIFTVIIVYNHNLTHKSTCQLLGQRNHGLKNWPLLATQLNFTGVSKARKSNFLNNFSSFENCKSILKV